MTEIRTWTLTFAAPAEWLSANKRYKRRPDAAIAVLIGVQPSTVANARARLAQRQPQLA
jgi:hypothetical protein